MDCQYIGLSYIANSVSFGSLKIAEYASQCPPLVPPIFTRRFDISQFTSHLSPIDFVTPPSVIVQRASFVSIECGSHCKACPSNVSMFQHRFVADHPLPILPACPHSAPLFLNHIWICSQIIAGFVPRPSAHLFPISCGLVSNWLGGFAEQETPYLLLLGLPYFSIGKAFRPLAQWVQGTPVCGRGCQVIARSFHRLRIYLQSVPTQCQIHKQPVQPHGAQAQERRTAFFKYSAQLFQSIMTHNERE